MNSLARQQFILVVVFFFFLSLVLIAPISSSTQIPPLADFINHLATIVQSKLALDEGQFPLRVSPTEWNGFRYPYYQFYSPSLFIFTAFINKWMITNPLIVFKTTLCCFLTLGGFYMFRLAYWFVKSWQVAVLTGVVYLATPYYFVLLNELGNLTESAALGLMPLIIFYTLKFYLNPKNYFTFLLATFAWYLLITVHIVTFVYTSFFVFLWLLLITFKNKNHYRNYISVLIMYSFSWLLAAWYIIPINLFSPFFLLSSTYTDTAHFVKHSPMLSELLFPKTITTTGSVMALDSLHPCIGWPIIFAAFISCYAIYQKLRINNLRANYLLPSLLIVFLIAFVMVWSPINFWVYLPNTFLVGQYSWRILSQVNWIGALLFAWAMMWLFKNKFESLHLILGTFVVIICVVPFYRPLGTYQASLKEFTNKPNLVYQNMSYLLNFNRNPKFVDILDKMLISNLFENFRLSYKNTYVLVPEIFQLNPHPAVFMQGKVSDDLIEKHFVLNALLDKKIIATYPLQTGQLAWSFSLMVTNPKEKAELNFSITRQADQKPLTQPPELNIEKIILSGFLSTDKMIPVEQTKKLCHTKKALVSCEIPANAKTELIELPVIYYPELIRVTLNDKVVAYKSILHEDTLLVSIVPEKNKMNKITVQFTGLVWANQISFAAWVLWGLVLLVTSAKGLTRRGPH